MHSRVIYQYSDVYPDPIVVVPNGFETIMVDGQTYYYSEGVFYQQIGDQLVAIQPVFGAVVDSIPQDYQIVMADGEHYLVTGGVYYQRVDQGFEVVAPPRLRSRMISAIIAAHWVTRGAMGGWPWALSVLRSPQI